MEFASSALHVRRRFLPTPNPTFSAGAITTFLRVPTRSNLITFALATDQFLAGVNIISRYPVATLNATRLFLLVNSVLRSATGFTQSFSPV